MQVAFGVAIGRVRSDFHLRFAASQIVSLMPNGPLIDRKLRDPMHPANFQKGLALVSAIILASCSTANREFSRSQAPVALAITWLSPTQVAVEYDMTNPTSGLHFAQELAGYRANKWQPADSNFRWVKEGDGERIERSDGKQFRRVNFTIPVDYRALPKSYAPFSPFSDGSTLIHSGQFHACLAVPCKGTDALPVTITAAGKIVGVEGRRSRGSEQFVSHDEGTNIFVGALKPVEADGFVAIIDPGLPPILRQHLDRSLPQSMRFFAAIYGPLSFKPELYISIDDRPEASGRQSTQGGTLPNQIFMHFDGENAKSRLTDKEPYWLDWFFAHEAAHLFQQDNIGTLAGDDNAPWLHEGGAEAMAALAMIGRGDTEQSYVRNRERQAEKACAAGLAKSTLDKAITAGNFDLHYQCGLVIWLALDSELRAAKRDGLNDLNRAFFARVRNGEPWNQSTFLATARELGVSDETLTRVKKIGDGTASDAANEIALFGVAARKSLNSNTAN